MTPLARDSAELLAFQALSRLVTHDELLPTFLGSTGASEDEFRTGARDPVFLGSVLDFVMMDDAWVTAFCEATDYPLDFPMRARAALPGGEQVNWT